MQTIKLTYNQERALRDNRYAEVRIKRNHKIMYITNNFDDDTREEKHYIAVEWLGNELPVKIKGNFED